MSAIDGATVLCQALRSQGVKYVFGVVGYPVIELAGIAQANRLKYIGFRNEQAACYAASAIGYLTKRPAVCLTVPGPGLLHAIPGMQNANENGWPVIVISGSMDLNQDSTGAFQELNQVATSKPFAKFSARPSCIERIPFYVEKAVKMSLYGRPGACYLDMPSDFIKGEIDSTKVLSVPTCPDPPRTLASRENIHQVIELIKAAKRPLVIIGKGTKMSQFEAIANIRAAYSRAEESIARLVTRLRIPFLPSAMAKGVLPDEHELCVGPARSRALQQADVIVLLGARLNWMLHFGQPPRFSNSVKFIQVDINAEELHNNVQSAVALHGDIDSIVRQINDELDRTSDPYHLDTKSEWWLTLRRKIEENQKQTEALISEPSPPMNYYNAFHELQSLMPRDSFLISEGSNTMDIGRTSLHSYLPRHRLDAGSYGTMGVGSGFAIAAALWCRDYSPGKRVVAVQGDSAFGFSGMEIETACRYKLPIIFVVINNNGIGFGLDEDSFKSSSENDDPTLSLLPTALTPGARYDQIVSAFGGKGYLANTREQVRDAFKACLADRNNVSLINVVINPMSGRKPQEFHWLTSKL